MSNWSVNKWLRDETAKHAGLLERMRQKLETGLNGREDEDGDGELTAGGVPNRHWCRAYGKYQAGMTQLLVEERERAKLQLMAKVKGAGAVLTDEEFEIGMRDLAKVAVRELPTSDLAEEIARRGIVVPVTVSDDTDD